MAAGNWGGSTTAVVTGSQHVPEAVEFAVWLNSDPGPLELMIKANNIFPATKAGGDLPSLNMESPYFGGQKINLRPVEATQQEWFTGAAGGIPGQQRREEPPLEREPARSQPGAVRLRAGRWGDCVYLLPRLRRERRPARHPVPRLRGEALSRHTPAVRCAAHGLVEARPA